MDSKRNSIGEKKGSFKLLDIAQGTVPAVPENVSTEEDTANDISITDSNKRDQENSATKEDCLKLLKESFDGYDYNGNGTVAHEEVREAWLMCQEEWNERSDPERCDLEASIFMKDIDKGGDDQVDFEEYVKYFRHLWLLSQGYEV